MGGKWNPFEAQNSFKYQLFILKTTGMWPPNTNNTTYLKIYEIYGIVFRTIFMYIYVFTQIMFFFYIEDMKTLSDALFLLLTQIALCFKMQNFLIRYKRIKTLFDMIDSDEFRPKTFDEEKYVKTAMNQTTLCFLLFFVPASFCISFWAISPLLEIHKLKLPLPAWYPFEIKSYFVFFIMYIYQIFGIYVSAAYNSSTDTFCAGLLAHVNAQILRLGDQISLVGYPEQTSSINSLTNNGNIHKYFRLSQNEIQNGIHSCVRFHKTLIDYCYELEMIFRQSFFIQLSSSVLIICMTLYQLISIPAKSVQFVSMVIYLLTMAIQVMLPCWMGNEIIFSSSQLNQKAFFSNIPDMDKISGKSLLLFMQRCTHRIEIKAGNWIKTTLSLQNYMAMLKTSYSYFALMQSMQRET